MMIMNFGRVTSVRVRAEGRRSNNSKDLSALRKKRESERTATLREHLSKLGGIATVDVKMIQDVFAELDAFHKDILDDKKKQREADVDEDVEDNIFLKKDD